MKKSVKTLIIIGSVAVALLVGVALFFGGLLNFHYSNLGHYEDKLWIENEEIKVTDYTTNLAVFGDEDDIVYVGFEVYDQETNKLLFKSEPSCRAWDYKGISFRENTNDIIVSSGDVGDIHYKQISEKEWQEIPTE